MKKLITMSILLLLFTVTLFFRTEIISFILENINKINKEPTTLVNNIYSSNRSYEYVKLTNNFEVKNIQDIKNVYYTILNSGMTDFIFYCGEEYEDCLDDINYISNNQKLLSHINNFVPVFNTFKNIETEFDNFGKITIHTTLTYSDKEMVNAINDKVNKVLNEYVNSNQSDEEKIKAIHDYIINNAKYDSERSDKKITNYHSDIAYGPLIEGYAICGGYTDAMKLFLDKLNIPNYKISSENHVWNIVNIAGNWLHLDLTWDDPVTSNGDDILEYDYFLITTKELEELESDQHLFDENTYLELKEKSV